MGWQLKHTVATKATHQGHFEESLEKTLVGCWFKLAMDAGSHNPSIQKETLPRERLEQGTKVSIVLASPISTPQTKQIWILRISLHT